VDALKSSELRSISSVKWSDDYPLLLHEDTDYRLSSPVPDETTGYNSEGMPSWSYGAQNMEAFAAPVIIAGQLLCPFFTVEAKAYQSPELGLRQNVHSGAVMLRILRMIRKHAGMEETDIQKDFDGTARVCMVTFAKSLIEIHCGLTKFDETTKLDKYHIYRITYFASPANINKLGVLIDSIRNAITYSADLNKEWLKVDLEAITNEALRRWWRRRTSKTYRPLAHTKEIGSERVLLIGGPEASRRLYCPLLVPSYVTTGGSCDSPLYVKNRDTSRSFALFVVIRGGGF
jgi:hypothetical protein